MGKSLAGEVVVLPFPQTNLQAGKRRPALIVADNHAGYEPKPRSAGRCRSTPGNILCVDQLGLGDRPKTFERVRSQQQTRHAQPRHTACSPGLRTSEEHSSQSWNEMADEQEVRCYRSQCEGTARGADLEPAVRACKQWRSPIRAVC